MVLQPEPPAQAAVHMGFENMTAVLRHVQQYELGR